MTRTLNWFGWSIETRAAVYESDQAARDFEEGLVNEEYIWTAFKAECLEAEKDKKRTDMRLKRIGL